MADPIMSADDFAAELADVVTRYMQHLEPTAQEQGYAVNMTVTGELLNIQFSLKPGSQPYISFTLQPPLNASTVEEHRSPLGRFGK